MLAYYSQIIVSLIFLSLPLFFTTAKASDDEMTWSYQQYNDETNKGRTTSSIRVGIPETDDTMLDGKCSVGSSGDFSYVTFGADISRMKEGSKAKIKFYTTGFQRDLEGTVVGTNAEFGVSGLQLILDNNDPLWSAFKQFSSMRYSVNDKEITLPLKNSAKAIDNFIVDCSFYAEQLTSTGQEKTKLPSKTENESPGWHISGTENQEIAFLYYGAKENDELTELAFTCDRGTGKVELLIMETNEALKPGESACVDMSVGQTKSKLCGATLPNELAGVPSFEAIASINDPIISALEAKGQLTIMISGKKSSIPLTGIGNKVQQFKKLCKPQP